MNKIEDILSATADTLVERGYHATNLDAIAERIDLTKASLYHYFPGKDDLITACLDWVGVLVNQHMTEVVDGIGADAPATDRLSALIRAQLDALVRQHRRAARLFLYPLHWPEPHREHIKQLRQQHDAIFRDVIAAGVDRGEFHVDDQTTALHCLHGAMNYVPVWYRGTRAKDFQLMADSVSATLLKIFAGAP
jgi:AcrR family transcriptional regulator